MIIKTAANGKKILRMSRKEWERIGRAAGFMKSAKWGKEDVVNPAEKGKYDGKSKEELESELSSVKERQESYKKNHDGKADPKLSGKIKELQFAIRAKSGWGKVE